MYSDAERKNVCSEVNVPPVSWERNAVPSERSLRPRQCFDVTSSRHAWIVMLPYMVIAHRA